MELRKRKAPAAPAPPLTKRPSSKKVSAAGKEDAAPVEADGASTVAGPGPVAGLGAKISGALDNVTSALNSVSSYTPTTEEAASSTAGAADANVDPVGSKTVITGEGDATAPSGMDAPTDVTGATAPAPVGTTAGLADTTHSGTTTAPPPQTLADPSAASNLLPTNAAPANPSLTTGSNDTVPAGVANAETDPAPPTAIAGATIPENLPEPSDSTSKSGPPNQGDRVDVATFGGTMQLEDGTTTNLAEILGRSKKGVVIFTYPKASTPGCTKQACAFRDAHLTFTTPDPSTGFSVFGLSRDSPKANTTFRQKQNLPYNLICDTEGKFLKSLGLAKGDKSATRGVVVISGEGKVLLRLEAGPDETVRAAREVVEREVNSGEGPEVKT